MLRRTLAPALVLAGLFLSRLAAQNTPATPEAKIAALGLTLPATSAPIANYVPAVRTGNLIFLSGHIPRDAENKVIAGKVGRDATEKDANTAARSTALALLATLKREIGDLGKVKRIVRVGGFVNAVDDFKTQPRRHQRLLRSARRRVWRTRQTRPRRPGRRFAPARRHRRD